MVPIRSDLVEVLVFSMVDMSRAKASATRLLAPPGSSFAVVSSYSSGSSPERDRKAGEARRRLGPGQPEVGAAATPSYLLILQTS